MRAGATASTPSITGAGDSAVAGDRHITVDRQRPVDRDAAVGGAVGVLRSFPCAAVGSSAGFVAL